MTHHERPRIGVPSPDAITGLSNLAAVRAEMPTLMRGVTFRRGNRYEDFDEDHDRMAAVGAFLTKLFTRRGGDAQQG